ncbi:MAG: YfcE family phosphodiesterase, partial [bacterium]
MSIGIISDTHDNIPAISYWMEFMNEQDVNVLIHAGDFISPFTILELNKFDGSVYGVFGNNDGDRSTLRDKAEGTSIELFESPHSRTIESLDFLISHRPED